MVKVREEREFIKITEKIKKKTLFDDGLQS